MGPERQGRLLDILGPFADGMPWSIGLREQFAREWSPADLALDIDAENSDTAARNAAPEAPANPYAATRMLISREFGNRVSEEQGDVRAVAGLAHRTFVEHFEREDRG